MKEGLPKEAKRPRRSRALGTLLTLGLAAGASATEGQGGHEGAVGTRAGTTEEVTSESKELEREVQREYFRLVDGLRAISEDGRINVLEIKDALTELAAAVPDELRWNEALSPGKEPEELRAVEWGSGTYLTEPKPDEAVILEEMKFKYKDKPRMIQPMTVAFMEEGWAKDKARAIYRAYEEVEQIGTDSLGQLTGDIWTLTDKVERRIDFTNYVGVRGRMLEFAEDEKVYGKASQIFFANARITQGDVTDEFPHSPSYEGFVVETSTGEQKYITAQTLSSEFQEKYELEHPGVYTKEHGFGIFRLNSSATDIYELMVSLDEVGFSSTQEIRRINFDDMDAEARRNLKIPEPEQ